MRKYLLITIVFLLIKQAYSQTELISGYLIMENNDTVFGLLKNKDYYSVNKIKILSDNKRLTFSKKDISSIKFANDTFVRSDLNFWSKAYFKKDLSGTVNLYTFRKRKCLSKYDSDITTCRLKQAIKLHCDDYPNINKSIDTINKNNVEIFLIVYNNWKEINPDSKSYFDQNIHKKPIVNFKLSFLQPGAGFEIGLGKYFSINSMLKTELAVSNNVLIFNPFIDTQLRYYHNQNKRIEQNKRTYKCSGNYLSLVHGVFLENMDSFVGFEYGWQRVISKHWYYNIGFGAGQQINGQNYYFLTDFDFGYNF